MEIYCQEISRGVVSFEISIHDAFEQNSLAIGHSVTEPPFHVFLTARDSGLRKIWSTPILSEEGSLKAFDSFDDALKEADHMIGPH